MATRAATANSAPARLGTHAFLEEVRERVLPELPKSLGTPRCRVVFTSLQVHFGEPRLHYEVWPVRKTGRMELGLHVEGPREWSRAVAAGLAAGADDLRAALSARYELEDWTASWCRLHRTLPLTRLDSALALQVSAELVQLIAATEPVLRRLAPGPAPATAPGEEAGRRFRRRRGVPRR